MALSNWDTFAIDHKGKAMTKDFISPLGIRVGVRKSWLYVESEKLWQKGGNYCEHVISTINEGNLGIADINIRAKRLSDDTEGIVAIVWCGYVGQRGFRAMATIGCYGYKGNEFIGVTGEQKGELLELFDELDKNCDLNADKLVCMRNAIIDPKSKRYNQGDRYFADKLKVNIPTTKVGQANEPVLGQMLKGVQNG
jgi:hypothetical protein